MTIVSTTPRPFSTAMQAAVPSCAHEKILLIVDDEASICAALSRLLGGDFNMVLTAGTAAQAVSLLNTLNVTHLICDYWLGNGEPQGIDLIPLWRKQYPNICRAILYTGTDLADITVPLCVDQMLSKSDPPSSLVDAIND